MSLCSGVNCMNLAGALQCPTCLKLGISGSFFCDQDCFKKSWINHKTVHKSATVSGIFNPFPQYGFTGPLRPAYPLSPTRLLPAAIKKPDYAEDGRPRSEEKFGRDKIRPLDKEGIEGMRKVCRLAREVLDIAAGHISPGVTTDEIDEIVHQACVARDAYPSPLNYYNFPKSVCTSVNEVICHGIPDKRPLADGDIVNLDVTLYHGGYHGDLNETYYVGEKARQNPHAVRVVETARECLANAISECKPGMLYRDLGTNIEKHAKVHGCSVVSHYTGHGINSLFHCLPNVPHYSNNKAVGTMKPGHTFTIEPMINIGDWRDLNWPDKWTAVTADGMLSAQFEHTLLVTETGVDVLTARKEDSPGGAIQRLNRKEM
ncbi:Methionine aminopeptidase 1 [Neolecta irregularis DAH-3]|uniref:Methionine aminopeptidase n=1 Tax=Neolecta irregularis (strain DAH-3) TaxID=1198029 RepID=A0A1U7LQT7_NEOID|nr:Methionine aminopeptidase 1 [Neolecta irregularis DAH-3]|eukprot:OLL25036.1 Methionine aminopeptidase 1 [Neolecta irregularis DAH-3]